MCKNFFNKYSSVLVPRPGVVASLFLVVRPGAPSSVLVPSSMASNT